MSVLLYHEISKILEVSQPLLMIDRASVNNEEKTASAIKVLSINEHLFQGHFPKDPILPGVMHIMGGMQVASLLLKELIPQPENTTIILSEIFRYKFRSPVVPGDVIHFEVSLVEMKENGILVSVKIHQGEKLASEGRLLLEYVKKSYFDVHRDLFIPSESPSDALDVKTISHHIPHRFPFMLVDRILKVDIENQMITGYKNVTGNDVYMTGLRKYAMPNAMLVEAAAQCACVYTLAQPSMANRLGLFFSIDHAKFYAPVIPGDQVRFNLTTKAGRVCFAGGTLTVEDQVVAEVEMKFVIVETI